MRVALIPTTDKGAETVPSLVSSELTHWHRATPYRSRRRREAMDFTFLCSGRAFAPRMPTQSLDLDVPPCLHELRVPFVTLVARLL